MRLRYWGILLAVGAWWMWPASPPERALDLQAAVRADGFVVIERGDRKRIIELDTQGKRERSVVIQGLPADTRVVGTPAVTSVIWQTGKQIAFARLDRLERPERFGKTVHHLCDQVASSARGWAFAWTEADGRIRGLAGPTVGMFEVTAAEPAAKQPVYCGVASADEDLALLSRTGDRVELMRCAKRQRCTAHPVTFDRSLTILGFGCTWHYCMIASRDRDGTAFVTWLDDKAKPIATKPLRDACRDTRVEISGEGDRFAIAYSVGPEPVVVFAPAPGVLKPIWQREADPDTVPALAWWGNTLMIAFLRDGALGTSMVVL